MQRKHQADLGRRERQIMDVIHRLGIAPVAEVLAALPNPPSYSAVRGMLRYLESKGHLRHQKDGNRYVYSATKARVQVERSALSHLIHTFFGGSRARVVAALLDVPSKHVSESDLQRLKALIKQAKAAGR
jgi:predicted transcriptional regulator